MFTERSPVPARSDPVRCWGWVRRWQQCPDRGGGGGAELGKPLPPCQHGRGAAGRAALELSGVPGAVPGLRRARLTQHACPPRCLPRRARRGRRQRGGALPRVFSQCF